MQQMQDQQNQTLEDISLHTQPQRDKPPPARRGSEEVAYEPHLWHPVGVQVQEGVKKIDLMLADGSFVMDVPVSLAKITAHSYVPGDEMSVVAWRCSWTIPEIFFGKYKH